jgi:hypothetical protein
LHVSQDTAEKFVQCPGLLSKFEGVPWADSVCIASMRCEISGLAKFVKQIRRIVIEYLFLCISSMTYGGLRPLVGRPRNGTISHSVLSTSRNDSIMAASGKLLAR